MVNIGVLFVLKQMQQDKFPTCFKTCGRNSCFFPKGLKNYKKGSLSGSLKKIRISRFAYRCYPCKLGGPQPGDKILRSLISYKLTTCLLHKVQNTSNSTYNKTKRRKKECFPNVKQVFLLYKVGSLVILIAYQPYTLEGSLDETPPSCEAPREPTIHPSIHPSRTILFQKQKSLF